ncbi:COMM domain-containing protein 4 [Lingula anatina]|uniref:COMM domain-containing protein 4 n=1 Tax=Lingula anatina TaxID=7574 RepID=A0A1S3HG00_LINAN|nr:COMM domain-containing protein 4 [Lingula anatina]|eukprot:XP_013385008.1 COMM domain-containing protein 4 [Lingula anatina]
MRFHFCGDLDCPDWVLAEISILAKLTSIKMKLLCAQVMKDMLGSGIDYEKVYKLTTDAKFELGDVKASIAALTFIFSSAAKYSVEGEALSNELQQLGLPKEHSVALCKVYEDSLGKLQEELKFKSLRLSHLESAQWRVDYVIGSSKLKELNEPAVQLRLKIRNPDTDQVEPVAFNLSADKFRVFLSELKQAQTAMEGLS